MSNYQFQPYPAHRHGPNGALRVVQTADEDALALAEGFEDHPSKVGKPKPAEVPTPPTPEPVVLTPAPAAQTKATKTKAKPPAEKAPEAATAASVAPAFDRAAAIARLEAASFEIEPGTTDAELIEALAELDKG